jgi:formylmethanofuran dehydrogenase subunit D
MYPHHGKIEIAAGRECLIERDKRGMAPVGTPRDCEKLLRSTFGGERVEFSTIKSKFESSYKPGGTLSAAVGPWANRVVKSGQDGTGCGRWTYLTYALKEYSYMTVITAYRVCKQHEPGPKTAYMQEHTIQYTDEELIPFIIDPHRQKIIDL